jgi:hypothetical protein
MPTSTVMSSRRFEPLTPTNTLAWITAEPRIPRRSRGVSFAARPFQEHRTDTGAGCAVHVSWSVCGASGTAVATTATDVVGGVGAGGAIVTAGSTMSGPLSLPSPEASPPLTSPDGTIEPGAVLAMVADAVVAVVGTAKVVVGRATATLDAVEVDAIAIEVVLFVIATGRSG